MVRPSRASPVALLWFRRKVGAGAPEVKGNPRAALHFSSCASLSLCLHPTPSPPPLQSIYPHFPSHPSLPPFLCAETGERPLPQASVLSGPVPRTGCAAVPLLPLPLLQHWAWEALRNQSGPSLWPLPVLLLPPHAAHPLLD